MKVFPRNFYNLFSVRSKYYKLIDKLINTTLSIQQLMYKKGEIYS